MVRIRAETFADLDAATLYALLRLRVDVFVVEQRCPYPELDGRDTEPGTRHVWLEADGEPVGYLRILRDESEDRIGRVCVAADARGKGHAQTLMAAALDLIGERVCALHAQSHLVPFYEGLGFQPTGPEDLDDGIPHVPMRRAAFQSQPR